MAFDQTVGGTDSNTYVTIAYANSYFGLRYGASSWSSTQYTDQQKALATSTFLLDSRVDWKGVKTSSTQALQWPRTGIDDVDNDVIPSAVSKATCELALWLLTNGVIPETPDTTIDSLKVGPISLDLNEEKATSLLPVDIAAIVSEYGNLKPSSTGIVVVDLVR